MPKLSNFEGQLFEFQHEPDKCYTLLADTYLLVNAHFNEDNIDEIAIKIGKEKIHCLALDGKITVNDITLYKYTYFPLGIGDYLGFAELRFNFFANNFNIPALTTSNIVHTLFVDAGKYNFYITRNIERNYKIPAFYNFVVNVKNNTINPGGLIVGGETEQLPHIWAGNFRFNNFDQVK